VLLGIALSAAPVRAQDVGDVNVIRQQTDTALQANENKGDEEKAREAEHTPLGIVKEIVVTGLPSVRDKVVVRQLTFKIGDTLTPHEILYSIRRLQQLGFFYAVKVDYEVMSEESAAGETASSPFEGPIGPWNSEEQAQVHAATPEELQAQREAMATRPLRVFARVFEGKSYYL